MSRCVSSGAMATKTSLRILLYPNSLNESRRHDSIPTRLCNCFMCISRKTFSVYQGGFFGNIQRTHTAKKALTTRSLVVVCGLNARIMTSVLLVFLISV